MIAIALGSNLGDRAANIRRALERLTTAADGGPAIRDLRAAPLFETPAELEPGAPAQPEFLNTAAIGVTTLAPEALLALLKRIEQLAGRIPTRRWAARPLDLDLLVYGDRVVRRPELTLPHPRLAERAFYLVPLVEIAPRLRVPPSGCSVADLVDALPATIRSVPTRVG